MPRLVCVLVDCQQQSVLLAVQCMHACMYVCMSVCLYVCLLACLSVCMSVCLSVCLSVYGIYVCVCMHVCKHAVVYACVRAHVCMYASKHVCMIVCAYACTYVCMHVFIRTLGMQGGMLAGTVESFCVVQWYGRSFRTNTRKARICSVPLPFKWPCAHSSAYDISRLNVPQHASFLYAGKHADVQARLTLTRTHTRAFAHTHTRTHARTHTRTHAHTHIQARSPVWDESDFFRLGPLSPPDTYLQVSKHPCARVVCVCG